MTTDRVQRRIQRLLDQIDEAEAARDWQLVLDLAKDVLGIEPENKEPRSYLESSQRRLGQAAGTPIAPPPSRPQNSSPAPSLPTSFANGRYTVKRFLGEGGKKVRLSIKRPVQK